MVGPLGKKRSEHGAKSGNLVSDVISKVIYEPVFDRKTDATFSASLIRSKTKSTPSSKRKRELPANFRPDPSNEQFAKSSGLDLEEELAAFRDLHGSLGNRRMNWQAVFRKHLVNAADDHGRIEVPTWLPLKYWDEFLKMRQSLCEGIRPAQQSLLVKKLAELKSQGENVAVVLTQSMEEQWAGVFPLNRRNRSRWITTDSSTESRELRKLYRRE